jgi:surface protein
MTRPVVHSVVRSVLGTSSSSWKSYWKTHSPTNLLIVSIEGGSRLTWDDNCNREDGFEIWVSIDGSDYVLLDLVAANTTTYDDLVSEGVLSYRVRAFIEESESEFTDSVTISISYFTTTWNTELAGSATKTIVIPTTGSGYDCYIKWDDEPDWEHITGTPGNITHVFATTGIKTIKIAGVFPNIYFNNAGDKLKLLTIANWGNIVWGTMASAFYGCANLTGTYSDIPDTTNVTSMYQMFRGCSLFNSPVAFNTANVTNFERMFYLCSVFNQSVSSFNTSKATTMKFMFGSCLVFNQPVSNFNTDLVTDMFAMFYYDAAFNQSLSSFNTAKVTVMTSMLRNCNVFNQSLASFNIVSVTDMGNMMSSSNALSTENYDATLIAWAAQAVNASVPFHAGDAKYSAGAAATARGVLTGAPNSWVITDGGPV